MWICTTRTIGCNEITFDGNGHSLTGSVTGEGVYIYEKSNVKVTGIKINNFSEAYPFYFPTATCHATSYQAYNTSQIELTDFLENSTENTISENTPGASTIGITIGTSEQTQ